LLQYHRWELGAVSEIHPPGSERRDSPVWSRIQQIAVSTLSPEAGHEFEQDDRIHKLDFEWSQRCIVCQQRPGSSLHNKDRMSHRVQCIVEKFKPKSHTLNHAHRPLQFRHCELKHFENCCLCSSRRLESFHSPRTSGGTARRLRCGLLRCSLYLWHTGWRWRVLLWRAASPLLVPSNRNGALENFDRSRNVRILQTCCL